MGLRISRRPFLCFYHCGACASVCPQHIDIPGVLKEYNEMLDTGPTWAEMCRQREEAAEKMRKQLNE